MREERRLLGLRNCYIYPGRYFFAEREQGRNMLKRKGGGEKE